MKTRNILIILAISFMAASSCKKEEEPTPAPTPTTPTTSSGSGLTSDYYFQATINDTVYTFEDGINSYANSAGAGSSSGITNGQQERQYTYFGIPLQSGVPSGGFSILKTFAQAPTSAEIEAMFSVKTYSFGMWVDTSPDGDTDVDGVVVEFYDASGALWKTDYGSGDQTGSTFSITEHINSTDSWSHKISNATFTCTLYDQNGNSMALTNGICRGRTVQY